jgi:hypothetical protein
LKVEPILIKQRQISRGNTSTTIVTQSCTIYDEYIWVIENGVYSETFTGNSIEICSFMYVQLPPAPDGGGGEWSWYTEDVVQGGGGTVTGSGGGQTIPTGDYGQSLPAFRRKVYHPKGAVAS